MLGAIHTAYSGFTTIQNIATVHVNSGFIRGIPAYSAMAEVEWTAAMVQLGSKFRARFYGTRKRNIKLHQNLVHKSRDSHMLLTHLANNTLV